MRRSLQAWNMRLGRIPLIPLVILLLINGSVLLGWALHSDRLLMPIASLPPPNPLSAVLFLLLTLVVCIPQGRLELPITVKRIVLALCTLLGLLEYLELMINVDFPFDNFIFRSSISDYQSQTHNSAMMSPNAAFNFFLFGMGLLLLLSGRKRAYNLSGYLFLAVVYLSMVSLISYLFGSAKLAGVDGYKAISLQSACSFMFLGSYALQSQPNWGFIKVLNSEVAIESSVVININLSILMLVAGGYLCLYFFNHGHYEIEVLLAILVATQILCVIYMQLSSVSVLYNYDQLRKEKEREIAQLNSALEQKVNERTQELSTKTAYLTAAEEIGNVGSWGYDFGTEKVFWSEETYRILGADTALEPDLEWYLSMVHPDDQQQVKTITEQGSASFRPYSYRTRIVRPDGSLRHIYVRCRYSFDEQGKVQMLLGVIHDVSGNTMLQQEKELALAKLLERNKKLEAFAHTVSHELRAPAANILGLIRLLQEEDGQEQEEIRKAIQESGMQLDTIIRRLRDILDEHSSVKN